MFDARATATGVLDRPDCDPAWGAASCLPNLKRDSRT
jgi:hypothetical protein